MEFQSEGWQAQDTGKASDSIPVLRQEKTDVPAQSSQAGGAPLYS